MNRIATLYITPQRPIEIETIQQWKPWALLYNGIFLCMPFLFLRNKKFCFFSTTLPVNRIPYINRWNKSITLCLLKAIGKHYKKISVLWIRDPDYYVWHNTMKFSYLVFDCLPKISHDTTIRFMYKEYFQKDWKFVYSFQQGENRAYMTRKSEPIIIRSLQRKNF